MTSTDMSTRGVEDADVYEGHVNGDVFCNFVERCLVPILQALIKGLL